MERIAGTQVPGFSGDGAAAVLAEIAIPSSIVADGVGGCLFVDYANQCVCGAVPGSVCCLDTRDACMQGRALGAS